MLNRPLIEVFHYFQRDDPDYRPGHFPSEQAKAQMLGPVTDAMRTAIPCWMNWWRSIRRRRHRKWPPSHRPYLSKFWQSVPLLGVVLALLLGFSFPGGSTGV
jgi:hypothetical protein